ncbi:MAG: hypothetical protein ACREOM_03555 [Candidatus Dormibacteraceae bacterium]
MSENYPYYAAQVARSRHERTANRPLAGKLAELLRTVRRCEAMWALEDRIERS